MNRTALLALACALVTAALPSGRAAAQGEPDAARRDRALRRAEADLRALESAVTERPEPRTLTPRELPDPALRDFALADRLRELETRLETDGLTEILPRCRLALARLRLATLDLRGTLLALGRIEGTGPEAIEARCLEARVLAAGGDPASGGKILADLAGRSGADPRADRWRTEAATLGAAAGSIATEEAAIAAGLGSVSRTAMIGALSLAADFAVEHPLHPSATDFLARILESMKSEPIAVRIPFMEILAFHAADRAVQTRVEPELIDTFEAEAAHGKALFHARRRLADAPGTERAALAARCDALRAALEAEEARRGRGEPATRAERLRALQDRARDAGIDPDFADQAEAYARDYARSSTAPEALVLLVEHGLEELEDRALRAIDRILEAWPRWPGAPDLVLRAARHHDAAGRTDRVIREYERFLATFPEHSDAAEVKRLLEEARRRDG